MAGRLLKASRNFEAFPISAKYYGLNSTFATWLIASNIIYPASQRGPPFSEANLSARAQA
jgi:hypothetical protein